MTIRSLVDGEQDTCLDLWALVFDDMPRGDFGRYFTDPHWHPKDTVICEEDGRVVSTVHMVRRVVETREGRRSLAGIANVITHPDFRDGGRATACLTEIIGRMEADPTLDFSMLLTRLTDFYARFGWTPWNLRVWHGENPFSAPYRERQSRPAILEDLDQIAGWHEAHNRNQPLAVVRDVHYWQDWMQWTPNEYLVCPTGYAHIVDEKGLRVVQACTKGFPWREACGTATYIRLCLPLSEEEARELLVNPTSGLLGGWMVLLLHNKPLPDLTNAYYADADGF